MYYSFFDFHFWLYFLLFLFAAYISFYIPGRFITYGIGKFNPVFSLLLSLVTGIVMWGFQGYIFGYFQLRTLTYLYIIIFVLLSIFYQKRKIINIKKIFLKYLKRNLLLVSLILLGLVFQLLPVAGSGLKYKDGVRIYGVNGTDGIMHLAYIGGMVRHMPPLEPGAYPAQITNYHYWSDLIIADIARIWKIPITNLFFQFFPALISILSGVAVYKVIREIGGNKTAGLWSVFFLYFGGDGTYLLMMLFRNTLSFDTPAIDNGVTQFLNMPNAMAKLVFLVSIAVFQKWFSTRNFRSGILSVIFFASLIGLKIYYGIFVALGFMMVIIFVPVILLFFKRKIKLLSCIKKEFSLIFQTLIMFIFFLIIGLSLYLPVNMNAGGLAYAPLEWPKIFMGPDILNWGNWWLRMQEYSSSNNYKYMILYTGLAIIISLICIHGTRLLGFFLTKGAVRLLGLPLLIFFIPGLILFNILGLITLQQAGGYNVFNFFVVSTVVLSLLLSLSLSNFYFSKNIIKNIFIISLILITIPRVIFEVYHYIEKYSNPTGKYDLISNDELDALNAIKSRTQPDVIIQSHPGNQFDIRTPYVSAFSDRFTFLSGVWLQETHNQKLSVRRAELKHIFEADIPGELVKRGWEKGISYYYLHKNNDEKLLFNTDPNLLRKFFENDTILILEKVTKK